MNEILSKLNEIELLLEKFAANGAEPIERDLILERIRRIYAALCTEPQAAVPETAAAEPVAEPEPEPVKPVEKLVGSIGIQAVEHHVSAEPVAEPADEPEPAAEPEPEAEQNVEPVAEPVHEPQPAEEQEPAFGPTVELEPFEKQTAEQESEQQSAQTDSTKRKLGREAILSLYNDFDNEEEEPVDTPKADYSAPQTSEHPSVLFEEFELNSADFEPGQDKLPEEEPETGAAEQPFEPEPIVLGDILAGETKTVADRAVSSQSAQQAASTPVKSLHEAIGVNDRFILMKELFGNNSTTYSSVIGTLDNFDSIDEAMLYIHDNFHWNPNSEGAKLLMDLLTRKLL